MVDIHKLRAMNTDDLITHLSELKNQYTDVRLSILNQVEKNTSLLGKIKKNVARVHTVINERCSNG